MTYLMDVTSLGGGGAASGGDGDYCDEDADYDEVDDLDEWGDCSAEDRNDSKDASAMIITTTTWNDSSDDGSGSDHDVNS